MPKGLQKKSDVRPIHDLKTLSNYRPLIAMFAKYFKKIVGAKRSKFLAKHKVLSHCQYGLPEEKSTDDAISTLSL